MTSGTQIVSTEKTSEGTTTAKSRTEAGTNSDPPATRRRWERMALGVLLALTALAYLWNLGASSTANSFYAAAVWAGTQSWKALLFGSLDPGNVITVDKPPAALWVMALSGRLFGFSPWSMLVPQALMGVVTVALLAAAVRRWAGPAAGLAAGAVLAFTPVAALMFRFNNPDALLVLLMTAAAYAVVRAVDAGDRRAATGWLLLAGSLIGFGFLTKMLQVMLVVPALAGVYLLAAPGGLGRRLKRLVAGGVAAVVSAGWYILLVELWPASARPYVGGSTDNSLLELALGYNGLSRIFGGHGDGGLGRHAGRAPGSGGMRSVPDVSGFSGTPSFSGFGGSSGVGRMFNTDFAGNISWLLPSTLILLVAGLWLTRRAPRTDRTRAALLLFGGWLLVTGTVFSFMSGVIHPYYVVAMAPALAGVVGVGARELWRRRANWAARATFSGAVLAAATWSWVLLARTPEFLPWLRWLVLGAGLFGAAALALPARRLALGRAGLVTAVAGALVGSVGAPTAYAFETVLTPHHGSIVSAGPASQSGPGGFGPAGAAWDRRAGHAGPGRGPMDASTSAELAQLLRSAGTTWSAATVGANGAASLELASGTSVIAIGGFSGGDPAPTLTRFQQWVVQGQVRYFVTHADGHRGGPGGERGTGAEITAWVKAHYQASTVGDSVVYDLAHATG